MTTERRKERALIVECENTIDHILAGLSADNAEQATAIVSEYLEIRGFGPVKEKAMSEAQHRISKALADYSSVSAKAA
jgi:indolepyruvate ferredoxin oxidoreductase